MKHSYLFIIIFACFLAACSAITGEEIARINIDHISTKENLDWKSIELDLNAGEKIHLWSEMDMKYEGALALRYQLQVIKDTDTLGYIEFDPMDKNITIGEIKTSFGNKTNWKFSGRSDTWNVQDSGHYFLRAILVSNGNESLELKKSDIVLKK